MSSARDGLARSLQAKLSGHAKRIGADPNLMLTRYAVERYLYRLSRSAHGEKFVLKGALLMLAWMGDTFRPTRDADMIGFGDVSPESLAKIFAEVWLDAADASPRKDSFTEPQTHRFEIAVTDDASIGQSIDAGIDNHRVGFHHRSDNEVGRPAATTRMSARMVS